MNQERRTLFPAIEPYARHRLKVSPIHEIYVAEYGNRNGKPGRYTTCDEYRTDGCEPPFRYGLVHAAA